MNSELCQNTFSGHKGNNGNVSCLWLSRTVVFLSKLWEPILCVDKLPENTATDKLNTNMCEKEIIEGDLVRQCKIACVLEF